VKARFEPIPQPKVVVNTEVEIDFEQVMRTLT
jgi:hypothetical protein